MSEFTENECLPKLQLKFKILENLRKPLTLKCARKRIDFERVSFVFCTGTARKIKWKTFGFAQVALAMQFKENPLPDS